MTGIIGTKMGMTQIFEENGMVVPVTVIQAGPCPVVQVRDTEKEGYRAVQLGFGAKKASRASKSEMGHAAKAGLEEAPAILREFRIDADATPALGEAVTVEAFEPGSKIKVTVRPRAAVLRAWSSATGSQVAGHRTVRRGSTVRPARSARVRTRRGSSRGSGCLATWATCSGRC